MTISVFPKASAAVIRSACGLHLRLAALVLFCACMNLGGCGAAASKIVGPPVFYPALPERPRVQFLASFTTEADFGKKASAFEKFLVGKKEQKFRGLSKPYGVAMFGKKIYVTDSGQRAVIVIDLEKKTFSQLAGDEGPGRVKAPLNIAISKDGHKFVADGGQEKVLEYDADDAFVRAFGSKGQFKPSDVAVWGNRLYVCDVKGHEIEVLDRHSGKLLFKIGKAGSGPGQFVFPTNIALDSQGNLYVTDTANFRVEKFSPEGKFLGTFGQPGDSFGNFARPKGVAVDSKGRIYVVDAAFENVQLFDDQFRLLLVLGGPGVDRGNLYLPADVSIGELGKGAREYFAPYVDPRFRLEYLLLVVSQYGPRLVNIYGMGEWAGPLTAPQASGKPADARGTVDDKVKPVLRTFARPLTGSEVAPGSETPEPTTPAPPDAPAGSGVPADAKGAEAPVAPAKSADGNTEPGVKDRPATPKNSQGKSSATEGSGGEKSGD